ncbi:FecR family protein [Pigmentiphaga soli]|uniref:FecR family protein n=1 Tax=Pigmentiphaga soli TaxID=1007095 RepID=A0ABP8GKY2_9BURK
MPTAFASDAPIPPEVRRAAAQWLVELQADSAGDATRRRWREWLDAHPDHRRAWQRIEALGSRLQGLPSPLAHAALAPAASARRRRAVKTLAVLLCAGGTAWLAEERTPWRRWTADRRTGTGERASLALADGTRVELAPDTAVDVLFTGAERVLRLVAGEILVATAHEAGRPFVVQTAQGRIRALGTRFNVRQLDGLAAGESRVAVYEGAVELRPHGGGERVLHAGEQARFTRAAIGPATAADEAASAWVQGMIVAQDMPLADFLAELGRYRPGILDCDPAVGALPVTGTYPLADTDRVLDMLRATLPVELRMRTRYWVTLSQRL